MYHQFLQGSSQNNSEFLYQNLRNKNTVKKDLNANITPLRSKSNTMLNPNQHNK